MTQDILYIESAEQAGVMLKPLRIELLRLMDRPRTCSELAEVFAETPQKIYYHVKALERARLVERCGERQVRGATEGFYRARARSYWLTPTLVRSLGGATKVRDQTSLTMLCQHAERMLDDAGRLARKRDAGECFGLDRGARREDADGDRQVEPRARFAKDGGGEINSDALVGEAMAGRGNGRPHSGRALPDRCLGQSDDVDARKL